jgi:hypothetical protein
MKLKRKLVCFLMTFFLVFTAGSVLSWPTRGSETGVRTNIVSEEKLSYKEKLEVIVGFMKDTKNPYLKERPFEFDGFVEMITLKDEVDTTAHRNFRWTWDIRYIRYSYDVRAQEGEVNGMFAFSVQHFTKTTSSNTERYILWVIYDYGMDGDPDIAERNFVVRYNHNIIDPGIPKDMIDKNWPRPTYEEAKKKLEGEIDYWYNLIIR